MRRLFALFVPFVAALALSVAPFAGVAMAASFTFEQSFQAQTGTTDSASFRVPNNINGVDWTCTIGPAGPGSDMTLSIQQSPDRVTWTNVSVMTFQGGFVWIKNVGPTTTEVSATDTQHTPLIAGQYVRVEQVVDQGPIPVSCSGSTF